MSRLFSFFLGTSAIVVFGGLLIHVLLYGNGKNDDDIEFLYHSNLNGDRHAPATETTAKHVEGALTNNNITAVVVAGGWRAPSSGPSSSSSSSSSAPGATFPFFVPTHPPNYAPLQLDTFTRAFKVRLDRAVQVAVHFNVPRIILTGGLNDATVSRAYIVETYAASSTSTSSSSVGRSTIAEDDDRRSIDVRLRVPAFEDPTLVGKKMWPVKEALVSLIVETTSRTTEENAVNTAKILREEYNNDNKNSTNNSSIIVVSNPGHRRRCLVYFRRAMAVSSNSSITRVVRKTDDGSDDNTHDDHHVTTSTTSTSKFSSKCNSNNAFSSSEVFFVGADRTASLEWFRPRGFILPPSALGETRRAVCSKWRRIRRVLSTIILTFASSTSSSPQDLENYLVDLLCAAYHTVLHHESRLTASLMSIPVVFEIREVFALLTNILQGKMSVNEAWGIL